MNRILKYMRQEAGKMRPGKSPIELPANATQICSFCRKELKNGQFSAYSRPPRFSLPPEHAICSSCIKRFATMARFAENFQIYYWAEPSYKDLKTRLLQRLYFEIGSTKAKNDIADIVIHLLVRKSARMSGEKRDKCPIMHIHLATRRIALVGQDWKNAKRLLEVACEEVGMGLLATSPVELESGIAYKKLVAETSNGEATWGCHDILFCPEPTKARVDCNLIFACESEDGIETGVEIIRI